MSGVHRSIGGGGGPQQSRAQNCQGQNEGNKCGGSGEKKLPPGLAKKGGSGEKGLPPGLQKKMWDGFDSSRTSTTPGFDYDAYINHLLGSSGSSQTQSVTGPKFDPNAPSPYSSSYSGNGVNGANGNGVSGGGLPGGVGGANGTPQLPDISGANGQAKPLPFVDQYNPVGKDANYVNGDMNCGPALLASIAKSRGQTGGLTDAQLINKLGTTAGTTPDGTSGNGMIAGLADLGMQTTAHAGSDLNWINSQLAQGHEIIANGDFYSVPGHTDPAKVAGHYVAVTGVNNGIYSVTDPAGGQISMTAAQLDAFIRSHPQGGFTIAAW